MGVRGVTNLIGADLTNVPGATKVIVGSNHFVDCQTIIALRQHALLRVVTDPLRVSFTTPPDLPSKRTVQVVDNERRPESDASVRVVTSDRSVAIFWDEAPLAIATLLESATVSVRLDLRPIGINLFEDALGLHVGANLFARNIVVGSETALVLG